MIEKNQRIQLKVLIKTRINQVKHLLNHSDMVAGNEARYQQEIESLKQNLKRLDDGSISVCMRCGGNISYTCLIARPESKYCKRCDQYL